MDILVVTDKAAVKKYFNPIKRSKTYRLRLCPCEHLKRELRGDIRGLFVYLDIDCFVFDERNKILKYLSRMRGLRYGIIDEPGALEDTASLFHDGASDYLDRNVLQKGIDARRLRRVVSFAAAGDSTALESVKPGSVSQEEVPQHIPSGSSWSSVRTGQEYTFCLMFVELDDQITLKNQFSDAQLNIAVNKFKDFIDRTVAPEQGRIWMWNEFGGLILFPYDGACFGAVLACMRLVLSRKLFSVEELDFKTLVSYRIALHIGNTVYRRRGDTGTIISSSINTIFHLGKKYVNPGNFYVTADVYRNLPQKLKKSFRAAGSFEGHGIMRMRLPV